MSAAIHTNHSTNLNESVKYMKSFGFIGCGNMGGTLAKIAGLEAVRAGSTTYFADHDASKAQGIAEQIGGGEVVSNTELAEKADFIVLGVKPQVIAGVAHEIAPVLGRRAALGERFVIVTMAAGVAISALSEHIGAEYPTIRIMPNTPAALGHGVILYCSSFGVTEDEIGEFTSAMHGAGELIGCTEGQIDAGSAISGCGPAYVYMFIEALADGGVKCGLPRAMAQKLAADTLIGAAYMALSDGRHPGELKDAVCSPGGSTIAGVASLEADGFRSAAIRAVCAAYERTLELG